MDTIRLKFKYPRPSTSFFNERLDKKELNSERIKGVRYAWTNNKWRKEQVSKGIYTPKFWIEEDFKDTSKTYFVIEASVPKLVFQENLSELGQEHFNIAVKTLVNFCQKIQVNIFTTQIENAQPTLVAIGKNIKLNNLCSCSIALKVLAPFDYKPHTAYRIISFTDYKYGGKELYFNIKETETTKFYDKKLDILNRAETFKEKKLAERITQDERSFEILRMERTFKTGRKINEKFSPFLEGKRPTFKNIFNVSIWQKLLAEEISLILIHPLNNYIFLSVEEEPFIDAFISKHFTQIKSGHFIRGFINELQKNGLAVTRKKYLNQFKSRQTWYNYKSRLWTLNQQIDTSTLRQLDSYKIHSYILKQFGINTTTQPTLFDTKLSKNIDT